MAQLLHVSKVLQRLVQHDDVRVFLLEASRLVLALVVPPLAKVLLHHVRLPAEFFVLSLLYETRVLVGGLRFVFS